MPAHAYNRKVRNWFRAYVDNFMGDTQLAKDIIKYGCHSTHLVARLVKATHLAAARLSKRNALMSHRAAVLPEPAAETGAVLPE